MFHAVLARLARVRVTLGYTAALVGVATALFALGPHVRDQVIRHASTNLHNLGEGRIGTLIGSAFVNEAGPIYVWLPGLVALLAVAELLLRSWRLVIAFIVGHIGATLLVAAGLAAAVGVGVLSMSIVNVTDVGMSYGAIGVLGALTAAIPRPWRAAWTGWWLAVAFGSAAVSGGDFTNVGHAVALVLGMVVGSRFGHPAHWTTARYGLLAVAVSFGYMILAYTPVSIMVTAVLGTVGGLLAFWGDRVLGVVRNAQRNSSALASIQSVSQPCGGASSNSLGSSHS